MKRSAIIGVLVLYTTTLSWAQTCNCQENFDFVYNKMKSNYAGWGDKVNEQTSRDFEFHTRKIKSRLPSATSEHLCFMLIYDWLSFFKDPQTGLLFFEKALASLSTDSDDKIRAYFASHERIDFDLSAWKKLVHEKKSIEGIWETADKEYQVAVMENRKNGRNYVGVVLKADSVYWTPGQVKFEIYKSTTGNRVLFYDQKHCGSSAEVVTTSTSMSFMDIEEWHKVFPTPVSIDEDSVSESVGTKRKERFAVKVVGNSVVLRIPDFGAENKAFIDSLIFKSYSDIATHQNLVIDVRGNHGGIDKSWERLIPFFYTNPVKMTGISFRSTDDLINDYKASLKNVTGEEERAFNTTLLNRLTANKGKFVPYYESDPVIQVPSLALPFGPRQVAIVFDKKCAGSCEQFLLTAKQSSKVKTFGETSRGALDYSNSLVVQCPYPKWKLSYATGRSNRLPQNPLDNIGVKPDVVIAESTGDWLGFTLKAIR